jgi:hypothetical protein
LRWAPSPANAASGWRPSLPARSASVASSCVLSFTLLGERLLHFQLNRNRGAISYPAFYSYAYPEPAGFSKAVIPGEAFYSADFREFILPYDVVRQSASPDETLLKFLQTTYEAAANLGTWDRASLERGA